MMRAAIISATTNPGTSSGAMPTKVLVMLLATATAGLAKKVDEVNQYPAVTVKATNIGTLSFDPDHQSELLRAILGLRLTR